MQCSISAKTEGECYLLLTKDLTGYHFLQVVSSNPYSIKYSKGKNIVYRIPLIIFFFPETTNPLWKLQPSTSLTFYPKFSSPLHSIELSNLTTKSLTSTVITVYPIHISVDVWLSYEVNLNLSAPLKQAVNLSEGMLRWELPSCQIPPSRILYLFVLLRGKSLDNRCTPFSFVAGVYSNSSSQYIHAREITWSSLESISKDILLPAQTHTYHIIPPSVESKPKNFLPPFSSFKTDR